MAPSPGKIKLAPPKPPFFGCLGDLSQGKKCWRSGGSNKAERAFQPMGDSSCPADRRIKVPAVFSPLRAALAPPSRTRTLASTHRAISKTDIGAASTQSPTTDDKRHRHRRREPPQRRRQRPRPCYRFEIERKDTNIKRRDEKRQAARKRGKTINQPRRADLVCVPGVVGTSAESLLSL